MRIGFVGVGVMGEPMCRNLLAAGHDLTVGPRSRERVGRLVDEGARRVDDLQDLARDVEVLLTCLGDEHDVEEVVGGQLLPALADGALLLDLTTSSPELAQRLASEASSRGVDVVDAPVSGGEAGARDGTLAIMVGGEDAAVERARPLLEILGGRVTHVGPPGAGQVCKAANQAIVGTTIAAVAEALLLAQRAGVDPAAVRAALEGGFADSRILQVHGERMLEDAFDPGFRAVLHQKDLRLALDLARAHGVALPTTAMTAQLFNALTGAGQGDLDHAALWLALQRLSPNHER
jgi:2-hydroxy-3-oxopropionate reductase